MASSSIPFAVQVEWYKIRDMVLGWNGKTRNVRLALELASSCAHPDARWLVEACAQQQGIESKSELRAIVCSLINEQENVYIGPESKELSPKECFARALTFVWCLGTKADLVCLQQAADMGYAFAQALMSWKSGDDDARLKYAQLSAAQGERDGYYFLGDIYREGMEGVSIDEERAKRCYQVALDFGIVFAGVKLGKMFPESDPERWRFFGAAAKLGRSFTFLNMFAHEIAAFNDGAGIASVVFAIGRALSGQVNESEKTIFGETESVIKFERIIGPVKQAIAFYEAQIIACRRAVACWTLVGIRFHVVKDIRKLIGGLIWDSRSEARHQVVVEKFVPIENSSDDDSSTHSPVSSSDSD